MAGGGTRALCVPQIFVGCCRNGAISTWKLLLDLGTRERGCEEDLAVEKVCLSFLVSVCPSLCLSGRNLAVHGGGQEQGTITTGLEHCAFVPRQGEG